MSKGWIGVDLDGTLAEYYGWHNGNIGKPIPTMVAKVKTLLAAGQDVRIMTARVSCKTRSESDASFQRLMILEWCKENLGVPLQVTCEKDFLMLDLYDDRCHQIIINTGKDAAEVATARANLLLHQYNELLARFDSHSTEPYEQMIERHKVEREENASIS